MKVLVSVLLDVESADALPEKPGDLERAAVEVVEAALLPSHRRHYVTQTAYVSAMVESVTLFHSDARVSKST